MRRSLAPRSACSALAVMAVVCCAGSALARPSVTGERAKAITPLAVPLRADAALRATPDAREWNDAALSLNPLDPAQLVRDAAERALPSDPMQVGLTRAMPGGPLDPAITGRWSRAADGAHVWRFKLQSPGALALRVRFDRFDLPSGASLTIAGADGQGHVFKGRGPNHDACFWSPSVAGDTALIEYVAPANVGEAPILEIGELAHAFRPLGAPAAVALGADLNCHLDAMCHAVNATTRDAVGQMNYIENSGLFICSGTLLNDIDPTTQIPWFLTANHCIDTQAAASTLEVVWLWQTPSCNAVPPSYGSRPRTNGATLLRTSPQTDYTLLRLSQQPPQGAGFAGWSTDPVSGPLTSVHHPNGSWKRYTLFAINNATPVCTALGLPNYIYANFIQGTMEGGSSGGPLINSAGQVVGQLFGTCGSGGDLCTTFPRAVYGRLSVSYNLGDLDQYLFTEPVIDDDYEDNDTIFEAATITAGSYKLAMQDDQDFFRIILAQAGRLDIQAGFSTSELDLDLELLTSSAVLIDSSASTTPVERITRVLAAGTYYLRAYRYAGEGGGYALDITFEPGLAADFNDDGIVDSADVATILTRFAVECSSPPGINCPDLSGDGVIDAIDLAIVLRDLGYRRAEFRGTRWKREMNTLYNTTIRPLLPERTKRQRNQDLRNLRQASP